MVASNGKIEMEYQSEATWFKWSKLNLAKNLQSCYGVQRHRITAPKTMIVRDKRSK
jgi:hypothetical protein